MSLPAQRDADVAGHTAGKVDDLIGDLVTARLQVVLPELIDLLRDAVQRRFPAFFHLIDRPTVVRAKTVREPVDLDLTKAVFSPRAG